MPPPHLHPRSRMTSSLFATTVLVSFCVVALPHVLPCPAPRVVYYDGEMSSDGGACAQGKGRRRRRRIPDENETEVAAARTEATATTMYTAAGLPRTRAPPPSTTTTTTTTDDGVVQWATDKVDTGARPQRKPERRECPVPKPGGVIGELLGFNKHKSSGEGTGAAEEERGTRPRPDR